ncbi:MAG: pentapeptide repeat-containing protein [Gaiellales bacterium]
MPAERHPAEPRLPDDLKVEPAGLVADGDELAQTEILGAAWSDLHLAALHATEVVFRDAGFSGSVLVDPAFRDTVFERANLANATFRGGSLTRVLVAGGRLTGLQVAETEIHDVVWRACGADMATFRHARLERVTFEDCVLREADFTGVRGEWVRFHDCDLRGAGFSHAELTRSEFRRCRMDDIEGIEGLRGTAMELEQMLALAPAMARALGVRLLAG